jgi:hypothetical protein
MPGYNSQRRGTARILPKVFVLFYVLFVLCLSVYCLCVNVYCTTATGWQPNYSLTSISIYQYQLISEVWSLCERPGHWEGESKGQNLMCRLLCISRYSLPNPRHSFLDNLYIKRLEDERYGLENYCFLYSKRIPAWNLEKAVCRI